MRSLVKTLQYVLALGVALVVLEGFLQWAEIQTPMETRVDPRIGPTFIPNKKVTRFNEGFYVGGTNRFGYLGPGHAPDRNGGELRILLLGDSYVMGMTVFNRHHFARALESSLKDRLGTEVYTLNFGKSDFNLSNMYQYYHDFASGFDHDLALFFVDQGDLIPAKQMDRDLYPFCYLEDGELMIDYSFKDKEKFQLYKRLEPLSEHSAFFRLSYNARKMVARGEFGEVLLDKFSFLLPERKPRRPGGQVRKAPDWTVPVLEELARDPKNVLVTTKELSPEVVALIRESGIATLDVTKVLDQMEADGFDPFYWPISGERGHWNQAAHAAIGRYLAEGLADYIGDGRLHGSLAPKGGGE